MNHLKRSAAAAVSLCIFTAWAEVVPSVGESGIEVSIQNKTPLSWNLGGVRFVNEGFNWTGVYDFSGSAGTKIINTPIEYEGKSANKVQIYYMSNAAPQNAKLSPKANKTFSHQWTTPTDAKPYSNSVELLLRTGSPGVPDLPVDEKAITTEQLKSLISRSSFYDPSYRPEQYDSLGVRGGRYSGGLMDTWLGETQMQFAIPGQLAINGTDVTIEEEKIPLYWMALSLNQEYMNIDMQWLIGSGAKETFAGTNRVDLANQYLNVTEYTSYHVEAPSGCDRALSYPTFFPKFAEQLSKAADVTTGFPGGIADQNRFMGYYCRAENGSTQINSATSTSGALMASLFLYNNYDLLSYAQDICWKDALELSKKEGDPYMGLGAMIIAYNVGMWSNIGNIASALSKDSYETTARIPSPKGRTHWGVGNFNYIPDMLKVVGLLSDASRRSLTDKSVRLMDFPITFDMLTAVFFGDGGTVQKQGSGGMLRMFYEENRTAERQKIWDTLREAFDILKGKAPSVSGQDAISYRYDYLAALRTVKGNFNFSRNYRIAGDASMLVPQYSNEGGCGGLARDDFYPYITRTDQTYENSTECLFFTVTVEDETDVKGIQWSIDNSWQAWNLLDQPQPGGNAKSRSYRFGISKKDANAQKVLGDGSGEFVWIMGSDAAGNSVVKKYPLDFKEPIRLDSAWALDTEGDGIANRIEAQFSKAVTNFDRVDYSWPAKDRISTKSVTKEDGSKRFVVLNSSLTGGASNGAEFSVVDLEDDGAKRTLSAKIFDRVGPAAKSASLSIADKNRAFDTLKLIPSEPLKNLDKSSWEYLRFRTKSGSAEGKAVSSKKVERKGDTLLFFFDRNQISTQDSVKFIFDSGIEDTVGNPPLAITKYVRMFCSGGREPSAVIGAVFDKNGDGTADWGSVKLTLGTADNAFKMSDAKVKEESWPTAGNLAGMNKTAVIGSDSLTFVPTNGDGSGKGRVRFTFSDTQSDILVEGDLLDRVGPVVRKTPTVVYTLPKKGTHDLFTLKLTVSEQIISLNNAGEYFQFRKGTGASVNIPADSVVKNDTEVTLFFNSDTLASYSEVRIIPNGTLEDEAGNKASENNQWVSFNRIDPNNTPSMIDAAVLCSDGAVSSGNGDRLIIRLALASGTDRITGSDLSKVVWIWAGTSDSANASEVTVTGSDTITLQIAKPGLAGAGTGSGTVRFEKNGITETVPFSTITDRAGPALRSARLYESAGSEDTLLAAFSEPVVNVSSGNLLNAEDVSKWTKSAEQVSPTLWRLIFDRAEGLAVGQWVNIRPESSIRDTVNNRAHDPNVKVQIEKLRRPIGIDEWKSGFFDTDADGEMDRILVKFNTKISADRVKEMVVKTSWPGSGGIGSAVSISASQSAFSADDSELIVDVKQENLLNGLTSVDHSTYGKITLVQPDDLGQDGTAESTFDGRDFMAPVLVKFAEYRGVKLSEDLDEFDDTLRLIFSEPISGFKADADSVIFALKKSSGASFTVRANGETVHSGVNVTIPVRVRRGDQNLPAVGDSIALAGNGAIRDESEASNIQNQQTLFVPFTSVVLPAEYELIVYPNPFTVKSGKSNELLEKYGISESYERMAVMVRPFGDRAGGKLEGRVTLFDAVGNTIVSNESMAFYESIGALIFVFDGTNCAGRLLGSGAYRGMVEVISKNGDSVQQNLIPIKIGIKGLKQ